MNLASIPDWGWILLAVAVLFFLYRNGWLDGLLKRPASASAATPSLAPTAPSQVITLKHVVESRSALPAQAISDDSTATVSEPVLEQLSVRGPLKIHFVGGKIDVTA